MNKGFVRLFFVFFLLESICDSLGIMIRILMILHLKIHVCVNLMIYLFDLFYTCI